MKFENLEELTKSFTKGKFSNLPEEISIKGVNYRLYDSSAYRFESIINDHKKPMVVYSVKPQKENMVRFE